jgi:hypothetical protein
MKPTTPPVRNAICIAFSRPPSSRAAAATRRFARVASAMPRPPIVAENTAPTTKKTDRPILTSVSLSPASETGSRNSSTTAMTTKIPSVLNWRTRYAEAPSCTAPAISCILLVPRPAASTALVSANAKPNATSAMTPAITT